MPTIEKIILKMSRQPHRQFINTKGNVITIKEENPLKAVYVKDVLKRIKAEI